MPRSRRSRATGFVTAGTVVRSSFTAVARGSRPYRLYAPSRSVIANVPSRYSRTPGTPGSPAERRRSPSRSTHTVPTSVASSANAPPVTTTRAVATFDNTLSATAQARLMPSPSGAPGLTRTR